MHRLLSFILSVNPSSTTAMNRFMIIMLITITNATKKYYEMALPHCFATPFLVYRSSVYCVSVLKHTYGICVKLDMSASMARSSLPS